MKKILVVDDDVVLRNFMQRILRPYSNLFDIHIVKNGKEAILKLEEMPIDLLVTDLYMPVMDGFELLSYMHEQFPTLPVFVMTAKGSFSIEKKVEALGSTKYFEKPIHVDTFIDSIFNELNKEGEGQIRGISLPSFLQLVEMEGKTCTLKIKSSTKTGTLHFLDGQIISASTGSLKNDEAALEIVSWSQTVITIENTTDKTKKEIKMPLMSILMEGLKRRDDREHEAAQHPENAIDEAEEDPIGKKSPAPPKKATTSKVKTKARVKEKVSVLEIEEKSDLDIDIERHQTETPPPKSAIDTERVYQIIDSSPDVIEFGIFDENDFLQSNPKGYSPILRIAPSLYFNFTEEIQATLQCGQLKYFSISTKDHDNYLFLKHRKLRIIIRHRPGAHLSTLIDEF